MRPFRLGLVCPHVFSNPLQREYQALEPGAEFADLARVPAWRKGEPAADCSVFPARRGFADLLGTFADPADAREPDWVTAVNAEEGWLWFALSATVVTLVALSFLVAGRGAALDGAIGIGSEVES